MSSYSYTVDVDLSSAAINVDVDPLDIGDVRDVKTSNVDLSIGSSSADINVSSNRGWLTSQDREALSLPTGSERFLFDVSNPSCYPGSGNTLFDLSSNGYDCVHRQLDILSSDPAADNSSNNFGSFCKAQNGGPASDSGTIIDFDVESNNTGTFVKINPNVETENVKYLSWDAPGTDTGTYTTFMVFENRDIDDYLSSTVFDYDNEVDDANDPAILGISKRISLNTRGSQGGISLRGHYTYAFAYDMRPFEGIPSLLFGRSVRAGFSKFAGQDYRVFSRSINFLEDSSYTQALLDVYPLPNGYTLTANGEIQYYEYTPYVPGNSLHFHPLTEQSPNVLSVTVDGPKARVYADGEFVVEMDIVDSILSSTSPRWVAGIPMNSDETLRVCGAQSANMYAWGMYDRALTTEEHLDIHKKYRIAPRPSKAVDVANLPDLVSFNVNEPQGRADANVDIDLSSSVTSVSVDPLGSYKALLYNQESFTTVGDWKFIDFVGLLEAGASISANETAPGSSNSDWLKVDYGQGFVFGEFQFYLALDRNMITDLGAAIGDEVTITSEIYLEGPWGDSPTTPNLRQIQIGFGSSFISTFLTPNPIGEEYTFSAFGDQGVIKESSSGIVGFFWANSSDVINSGCVMYLRNFKITANRFGSNAVNLDLDPL